MADLPDGSGGGRIPVEDLAPRKILFECHEELLGAAREFGALMLDRARSWEELEETARHLDDAAVAYALAWQGHRAQAPGAEWRLREIGLAGDADVDAEEFARRLGALFEGADTVGTLLQRGAPPAAVEVQRARLGQAAIEFYLASRQVLEFTVALGDEDTEEAESWRWSAPGASGPASA